jgi:hypothetical protein
MKASGLTPGGSVVMPVKPFSSVMMDSSSRMGPPRSLIGSMQKRRPVRGSW